jgi:hypothetical protein
MFSDAGISTSLEAVLVHSEVVFAHTYLLPGTSFGCQCNNIGSASGGEALYLFYL